MTTQSASLQSFLWQSSTIGIGLIDAQRRLIEANDTFCDIYGYKFSELLNLSIDKLVPQHFRDKARLSYQNYVSGDLSKGLQYIQRKDGAQQYVKLSVDNISTDSGDPLQLITVTALPAPQISEKSQDFSTSLSNVFLFECDNSGKCLKSNTAAQQKLGIYPERLIIQPVTIYSGHIQRSVPLAELLAERKLWENAEWKLQSETENSTWVLANAQLTKRSTTLVCLVSINEQKRLENTLTRNLNAVRSSNEHLQHFLYGATHDLKAPLASLLGLIDIFRHEEDAEQKNLYLQLMEKSIHRLNEFIHEIVDYSKHANQELRREPVDFNVTVKEAFESLEYTALATKINKIVDIHQKEEFYSDPHSIKVILNNLISNAYKYSSTHRRPGEIRVSAFVSNQEATLQICDNGQGIAKEHLSKIFDMFYRASSEQNGSGLGLYLVKEAVDKMKGKIHVDSKLGVGTTFTISIPSVSRSQPKQMSLGL